MDLDRLTRKSQEALQAAVALAAERHHTEAGAAHLLAALLGQPEGVVLPLVQRLGVTPTALRSRVNEVLDDTTAAYGATGDVRVGQPLVKVLEAATKEAQSLTDEYVSTEHLLIALVEEKGTTARQFAYRIHTDLGEHFIRAPAPMSFVVHIEICVRRRPLVRTVHRADEIDSVPFIQCQVPEKVSVGRHACYGFRDGVA